MASSATAFNTNNASLLLLLFIFFSLPSFDFKKFWPLARLSFLLNFNVNIQYFPFGKKRYIVEAIELSTRNLSRNQFHSTRKFFWVLSVVSLIFYENFDDQTTSLTKSSRYFYKSHDPMLFSFFYFLLLSTYKSFLFSIF